MTRIWAKLAILFALLAIPLFSHEGMVRKDRSDRIRIINQQVTTLSQSRSVPEAEAYEPATVLNHIDELTFKKMNQDGVPVNGLCDDSTFIRRLSLLLTGRLPDPAETRAFLASTDPEKRADLIDQTLESEAFNTFWSFWFQEYFESATRILRAGQRPYNEYLADAVASGKKLDVMALEMLTASGLTDEVAPANFYARANGMSRLQQDFWDNTAIAASSKFLGVPLDCISCHDGAYHLEEINLYLADRKREDVWGMAAFFSEVNIRPGRREGNLVLSANIAQNRNPGYVAETDSGDRPVRAGGLIPPKNMFTGAGVEQGKGMRQSIAEQMIADRQFARNFANRFWGHLFGLAMVEPMDGFDLYRIDPERELPEGWEKQALDLDLLEHMTDQLIGFNYDLRDYLRYVLNSATFQMSSEFLPGSWQASYAPYYSRYLARHMTAEMVYDSVVVATGVEVPLRQNYFGERGTQYFTNYAHGLIDNSQPRVGAQREINIFLQSFGRGNRFDLPRSNQGSISQALLMMNSPVINEPLTNRQGRVSTYLSQNLSEADIIRELYLDIYCREPTTQETDQLVEELAKFESTTEKATTVMWLLLNRVEFTFIY